MTTANEQISIKKMDISLLKPYPGNPRINDRAITPVANSIKEFGFQQPIVVDKDLVVIVGHTRLLAAKSLGLTLVPVVVAEHLSPEQVKSYRLADNRTNQNADWDWSLLGHELTDLLETSPELVPVTGFDKEEIKRAINWDDGGGVRVTVPKEKYPPITVYGTVWTSSDGEHTVICAENSSDLAKATFAAHSVDCIVTDPPYNLSYSSGAGEVKNDTFASEAHFTAFLKDCFAPAVGALRKGGAVYTCGIHRCLQANTDALAALSVPLTHELIWAKSRKSFLTGGKFTRQHENIWYGHKTGASQHGPVIADDYCSLVLDEHEKLEELTKDELITLLQGSVLDSKHDKDKFAQHPTVKPFALLTPLIKSSTFPGDLVCDIFSGSGSTALACYRLGRKSLSFELDPNYVDVILTRLYEHHQVDFTNQEGQKWSTLWDAEKLRLKELDHAAD